MNGRKRNSNYNPNSEKSRRSRNRRNSHFTRLSKRREDRRNGAVAGAGVGRDAVATVSITELRTITGMGGQGQESKE